MKKGFKRVVSTLVAFALSSSLAAPFAIADDTTLNAVNSATADTIAAAVANVVADSGKFDYSVLPECDQKEINDRMLKGGTYASNEDLYAAYQSALEKTTQVDTDLYAVELIEDFSNLDSGWTKSNPEPYVGATGQIDASLR